MPDGKLHKPPASRIALLWAVLFLALRTEEPHTHIKQTKNMSQPKKHSMSQRQHSVVTSYLLQMVPGHSLSQYTKTVQTEPLQERGREVNQLNKSYITSKGDRKNIRKYGRKDLRFGSSH